MLTKALLLAGIALGGFAASSAGVLAASSGVMDCRPHDWHAFGEAIEAQDNDALFAMLSLPELGNCDPIIRTIEVLLCDVDPSACAPVVIVPDPVYTPPTIIFIVDDVPPPSPPPGPFPGQRPGEQLGIEQDRSDNSSAGGGGGGGGGTPSGPSGAAPGGRG